MQLFALVQDIIVQKRTLFKTLLIMKLAIMLTVVFAVNVSAKGLAQKVSLAEKNVSMEKIFQAIRSQTGYDFIYSTHALDSARNVSIDVKDAQINEVMDKVCKDQPFTYTILEKTIVIKRRETVKKEMPVLPEAASPPPNEIHGKVTDSLGNPLGNASVLVKGTKKGTQTDAKGNFILLNVDPTVTLAISFTGYFTKEVAVNGRDNITVALYENPNALENVIVNKGYYSEKKELSTGDVGIVTAKQIEEQPIGNVLQTLEGQVAGLVITQQNGQPGGAFTVQIRGVNSIIQGNNPFYVIDGVPYDAQLPVPLGGSALINSSLDHGNPLNFINPYDIESVEILKDADATAIYGSRAANGAILITTKKGKPGNMQVNAGVNYGFSSPAHTLPLMNTQQYLQMREDAFKNDGASPDPNSDFNLTFWDTSRYTNWEKTLMEVPAPTLNGRVSVSGGTGNTQYLIGMDYSRQTTPFPTLIGGAGADEKPSFHFSLSTASPNQKFHMTSTASYLYDRNTVQSVDLSGSYRLAPDAPPIFNPDGSLNWAPLSPGQAGTWTNPYASLYETYRGITSTLVANTALSYNVLRNLQARVSLGYTNTQIDEVQTNPTTANDPGYGITTGYTYFNESNTHTFVAEPQLSYDLKTGKTTINATLGGTYESSVNSVQGLYATNFLSDAELSDFQVAGIQNSNGSGYNEDKYEGVYLRLNYNFADKYILNLTGRRDGSSRFGPGSQFGNFGAAGVAWLFSKETWVSRNLPFLSLGKIRGNYGITGSDQVNNYSYLQLYNVNNFPYNQATGVYPAGLLNPNLAWEADKKLEGGLELSFLDNRIMIEANYYQNRSNNQLVSSPEPYVTGFSSVQANLPASVQNSGQEYSLHTTNFKSTHGFNWTTSFNIALNRNKLLSFPGLAQSHYSSLLVVGQPLAIIKAYDMVGVNPATGLYQFKGADGQLTYNPNYQTDKTELISTMPKFTGGFSNSFSYKGVTLDVLFQFAKQTGTNLFGDLGMPGSGGAFDNEPVDFLNAWQKPGDHAKYEMYSQNYGGQAYNEFSYAQQSNFAYSDASYIRLKNLSLSWALPESWDKTAGMRNIKVFIQCKNLLTITKYTGLDPESQGTGLPPLRVVSIGGQVSF